jgi:integrase
MSRLYRRPDEPGGTYYLDYTVAGRRRRESLQTTKLKEAKDRRDKILRGEVDPKWGKSRVDITPDEFWAEYLLWAAEHKSPRTVEREETHWSQFLIYVKPKTLGSVTRKDVNRLKEHLSKKQKLKNVTVKDTLRRLQALYNRAMKMGVLAGLNPFQDFDRLPVETKPVRYLDAEELETLIETAHGHSQDIFLFCALCAYAGLRSKEAVNCEWKWIDFKQGTITVQGNEKMGFTTKSRKHRTVPLNKKLRAILLPIRKKSGYLIMPQKTDPGKWRVRYEGKRAFGSVKTEAGLPWATPHALRHTFASLLLISGVSLYKVSRWLGHSSINTTHMYAHLPPHDDDIDRL